MAKKEEKEEQERLAMKHGVRTKNNTNPMSENTFFDFLAGNVDDENYNVNPYKSTTTNSAREHREDSGFGSANLSDLSEQPVFY